MPAGLFMSVLVTMFMPMFMPVLVAMFMPVLVAMFMSVLVAMFMSVLVTMFVPVLMPMFMVSVPVFMVFMPVPVIRFKPESVIPIICPVPGRGIVPMPMSVSRAVVRVHSNTIICNRIAHRRSNQCTEQRSRCLVILCHLMTDDASDQSADQHLLGC